ncbi:hypothetical protein AS144_05815 [Francisella endosymbiont of Amblyomma maculatum]|nr:hypothetical protein AS144_05815 [Francisella endosymbiont of Amblyomma maculatum]
MSKLNHKNKESISKRISNTWKKFDGFSYTDNKKKYIISDIYYQLKLEQLEAIYIYELAKEKEKQEKAERDKALKEQQLIRDQQQAQKEEEKYHKMLNKAMKEAEKLSGGKLKMNAEIAKLKADFGGHTLKMRELCLWLNKLN